MALQVERRREVKISYTSKVFLHQEPKPSGTNGDVSTEEVTSYRSNRPKRITRCVT